MEIIVGYEEVLKDVSKESDRLVRLYGESLVCKKGCSACCTDISLLPLEWYTLRERITSSQESFIPENTQGSCALLKEKSCSFYSNRPLICRTHGLPLLYLTEEYDAKGTRVAPEIPDWQISWCDLNFTSVTDETMEEVFDPEDVLNMEEWNTHLKQLNQEFLKTEEGAPFRGKERISIQDLFTKTEA
ncbi:YkgJ family cysteine cluster protein [Oceanispirochaeta crateris]|nr:YkgJ family cysteine cluster protein [Oceanispirochaeta crateris]